MLTMVPLHDFVAKDKLVCDGEMAAFRAPIITTDAAIPVLRSNVTRGR